MFQQRSGAVPDDSFGASRLLNDYYLLREMMAIQEQAVVRGHKGPAPSSHVRRTLLIRAACVLAVMSPVAPSADATPATPIGSALRSDPTPLETLIVPPSEYTNLTVAQPNDSKRCKALKESTAERISDRDSGNRSFLRQLKRRLETRPQEQIEVRIALPSIEPWDDIFPPTGSGVTLTRMRFRIDQYSGGLTFIGASEESKFDEAVEALQRSLRSREFEVENRRKRVEKARKNNPNKVPERLLAKLARAEEQLALATARVEELSTRSTLPVNEVSLHGTPSDIIDHLGPVSVYEGARYQDLTKSRNVVRIIKNLYGLTRKAAIKAMKKAGYDHWAEVHEAPMSDDYFNRVCGS